MMERNQTMSQIVVLDACVLFPAPLRDTLLRAARANLYSVQLTDEIIEEVRRNLVNKRNLTEAQAQRLISAIQQNFKGKFVTDYQSYIASMPINKKDRHVLAAAVACQAQTIVTHNLKDFPPHLLAPYNIEAISPDIFLISLFHNDSQALWEILRNQAEQLRNPPMSVSDVLNRLTLDAPNFVRLFRSRTGLELW
jgi:predicted nucleic acid-binding protein